jgi:hypothetical protein
MIMGCSGGDDVEHLVIDFRSLLTLSKKLVRRTKPVNGDLCETTNSRVES